jgi:hypothetical protein
MSTTARGDVFITGGSAGWKILAWTGLLLIGSLYVADPREPLASSIASIHLAAADSEGTGSSVGVSVHHDGSKANEGVGQLFGMQSEPVMEGALLDKWSRVQDAIGKLWKLSHNVKPGSPAPRPSKAARPESRGRRSKWTRTSRPDQQSG